MADFERIGIHGFLYLLAVTLDRADYPQMDTKAACGKIKSPLLLKWFEFADFRAFTDRFCRQKVAFVWWLGPITKQPSKYPEIRNAAKSGNRPLEP